MGEITSQIERLPSIEGLLALSQAIALADAILMPEWEYRYFSFNNNWDGSGRQKMASMRDGSGTEYFILFAREGVASKVYVPGKDADSHAILDSVPKCFSSFKAESAFALDRVSFCFWKESHDTRWSVSPSSLPEFEVLEFLIGGSEHYRNWAQSYYETSFPGNALAEIFTRLTVREDDLRLLNPGLSRADLEHDIGEILG